MRKLLLTPAAAALVFPLLAGCGGSSGPSATSSTSPSSSPTSASSASANAAVCNKLRGDSLALASLATMKNPTKSKVAAEFRTTAQKFQADASSASGSLKAAVDRLSAALSREGGLIASGKVSLSKLGSIEAQLGSSIAPLEQACGAGAGASSSPS